LSGSNKKINNQVDDYNEEMTMTK